jgi:glycosyltransferase involved in cell wall biosynthesis
LKLVLVTDTWTPEVNGVVRTLRTTMEDLRQKGHEVRVVHPGLFPSSRFPLYPDVRLSWTFPSEIAQFIADADHVHIATEGPLGVNAALFLRRRSWCHSSSFHTDFPSYLRKYLGIPARLTFRLLRVFHNWSRSVMVATRSWMKKLEQQGFQNLRSWARGVDTQLFRPAPDRSPRDRPLAIYVGRVAQEKNVTAFLDLDRPVEKLVVGDGPLLSTLKSRYPHIQFVGALHGEALARAYAAADVVVFPSWTDTFGLVMLEALACGTPVAAYPAEAPSDLLAGRPEVGCIHHDLGQAVDHCLTRADRQKCREMALQFTWEKCTSQFINNLVTLRPVRA